MPRLLAFALLGREREQLVRVIRRAQRAVERPIGREPLGLGGRLDRLERPTDAPLVDSEEGSHGNLRHAFARQIGMQEERPVHDLHLVGVLEPGQRLLQPVLGQAADRHTISAHISIFIGIPYYLFVTT